MSRNYDIGDKVVDKASMRMGTVIDLVEERDEEGNITNLGAKMDFGDGQTDWVSGDNVAKMLVETESGND